MVVAKNYLTEPELAQLSRLVNAYLDVAEDMALRKIPGLALAVARDGDRFAVGEAGHQHWVSLAAAGATCTCRWFTRYGGGRGPCSHILAAMLVAAPGSGTSR